MCNTVCILISYICVCICMYICVCICMYIYVCVCVYVCMYVYVGVYVQIHICIKKGKGEVGGGGGELCLNTSSRVDQDTRRPFSLAKQRRLHVISITD